MRTVPSFSALLAACRLAACAVAAAVPCSRASGDLPTALQKAIGRGQPAGSSISVSVRTLPDGDEIFRHKPGLALIPASNMKIVTTGAALVSLGADFVFRSQMHLGDRADAPGDLTVVGDGDPAFADPTLLKGTAWNGPDGSRRVGLECDDFLSIWSDSLTKAGLVRLGAVVVDDRIFEREGFHPEWPRDQFTEPYCSEVRGLNFHHNLVQLWPKPIRGGAAGLDRMEPGYAWLALRNRTSSNQAASAKHSFWIGREFGSNTLTLNGNVRVAPADPVAITLHDTPSLFGELFRRRLREAGVAVDSSRLAGPEDRPDGRGRPIGPPVETPLPVVLRRANTDSDNLSAECLLKRVAAKETGQPGSWSSAATVLPKVLARRLPDASALDGFVVSDGSGLSRNNRVTASLLTRWIAALDADPRTSGPFRESLAVGGESGTVKSRFKSLEKTGGTVLCKTGFVRGVSCLSGIVVGPDGRSIAFSVLGNNLTAENAIGKAKELQEAIVLEIAKELARPRAALGG